MKKKMHCGVADEVVCVSVSAIKRVKVRSPPVTAFIIIII